MHTSLASRRRFTMRGLGWLTLLGIVAISFWLRYAPVSDARPGDTFFLSDSAFHYRLAEIRIETGRLEGPDPLFSRNPPRRLDSLYPPNLYILSAGAYRLVRWIVPGDLPLDRFFVLFNILCALGPLLAAGWLVWEVSGRGWLETLVGTALCAVATPLLLRSHAGILRHETLGTGLCLLLACLMLYWDRRPRGWRSETVLCATVFLTVFLGAGFWRLFPALAGLIVLGAVLSEIVQSRSVGLLPLLASAAAACLAAGLGYDLYSQQGFSSFWVFSPLLAAPLLYLGLQAPLVGSLLARVSPSVRIRWIVAGVLLAALAGVCLFPVTRIRIDAMLNPEPVPIGLASLYGLLVEELMPLPLSRLFTSDFVLYLPVLYLLPLVFRHRRWADDFPYRFAGILMIGSGLLSLLFVRFVYLAYPILTAHLVTAVSRWARDWQPRWKWWTIPPSGSLLVGLALFLPAIGLYIQADAVLMDGLRQSDPDLVSACHWLRTHVPPGEVVVAEWSHGFEVQTYAGCRTPMDGFLEDETNRRRILQFLQVMYSDREEDLLLFVNSLGGRYLFLDRAYLIPTSRRLNLPWTSWLGVREEASRTRLELTEAGKRINYIRGLFWQRALRHFRLVYESGNLVILERQADPKKGPAGTGQ